MPKEAKSAPKAFYYINTIQLKYVTITNGNYTVGKPDRKSGECGGTMLMGVYEEQKCSENPNILAWGFWKDG